MHLLPLCGPHAEKEQRQTALTALPTADVHAVSASGGPMRQRLHALQRRALPGLSLSLTRSRMQVHAPSLLHAKSWGHK